MHPLHSCYLGLRGLPSLHGPPAATLPGLAWTNLPDLRLAVGGLRLSSGASPRRVPRCSVQQPAGQAIKMGNAEGELPQLTPDAKGGAVPERKFGSEALEGSAKLRKSSIECLSAASFEAACRGATEAKGWHLLEKHAQSLARTGVLNSRNHTFRKRAAKNLTTHTSHHTVTFVVETDQGMKQL